jgi:TRAP-type uncharacterized transport system fused permease subunit
MRPWFERNKWKKSNFRYAFSPKPIAWQGWAVYVIYIAVVIADCIVFPPWRRPISPTADVAYVAVLFAAVGLFFLIYLQTREKDE